MTKALLALVPHTKWAGVPVGIMFVLPIRELALEAYIDWKLKGSFWISGGYEQNYKTQITSIDQLYDISAWQQSGLIGISKVVSVKSKMFKKTKIQLLWDFLSYQQIPRTHPITIQSWI
jgi:hypothetical protein